MNTSNVSYISSVQPDFTNLAEYNSDPSSLPSTSMFHSPPPPLTVHPTPPPPRISPPSPKPVTQAQQPRQNRSTNLDDLPPETADILDYMIWSEINFVLGAVILGIPGIILSILTKKHKREGNVSRAKIFSSIALGVNIFVSFVFMCGMVYLITHFNNVY